MVYAHCLDYKSINQMERWYSRTDLAMILAMEDITEIMLLKALDSLEKQKMILNKQPGHFVICAMIWRI